MAHSWSLAPSGASLRSWFLVACVGALLVAWPGFAAAEAAPDENDALVERGATLLRNRACLACHSDDGTPRVGPTLLGLMGRSTRVTTPEGLRELTIDAAYVKRSLLEPNAEVVDGFQAGTMPMTELSDEEHAALLAVLQDLSRDEAAPEPPSMTPLVVLAVSAVLFVLFHLFLSSAPVRGRLVAALGEMKFQGVYSLPIAAAMGAMIWGWSQAPFVVIWNPAPWTMYIPLITMPVILWFFVAGYSTPSPTMATGAESDRDVPVTGVLKITRHPANLSQAAWGAVHLCVNGDLANMILFSSVLVLGVVGSIHIDRRRRAEGKPAWERIEATTSLVPFAALIQGRAERFTLTDLGWWRVAITAAIYGGLLWGHTLLVGASPLPIW